MTELAFLDIGFGEMVVVAFVALLLFGGRLPEVMRTLGGTYRKFRAGMDELTRQTSKVLDVRPSSPPYKPTPPAAAPVATPSIPDGPANVAKESDAGPVASSMTVARQAPSTSSSSSDDPPPV